MKFHFDGRYYNSLQELGNDARYTKIKEPIMVTGSGLPDEDVAYVFATQATFKAWTDQLRLADEFEKIRIGIKKMQSLKSRDNSAIFQRQIKIAKRIEEDMQELSTRTGLQLNSKELFLRATLKADPLEGRIFDPALLHTGANFTGDTLGVTMPLPDLGIFPGMNNNVSSIQVLGICILFDGTWFTGPSHVIVGTPYRSVANLGTLGFDNMTSSVILL